MEVRRTLALEWEHFRMDLQRNFSPAVQRAIEAPCHARTGPRQLARGGAEASRLYSSRCLIKRCDSDRADYEKKFSAQSAIEANDDTRMTPCFTRFGHIATIARISVTEKTRIQTK